MIPRFIKPLNKSFFLFGPRGTGKTTWLKSAYPDAPLMDLLDESAFQEFALHPHRLEAWAKARAQPNVPFIIDEIQRVPELLNEVHRLMESLRYRFILTGSSARKLKQKGANLLAGRALVRALHPLTAAEIGKNYDLKKSLLYGQLPMAVTSGNPKDYLKSYIGTYLKEEILQEALIRRLNVFGRFLEAATFSQASILNTANVAAECGIDRKTADNYFQILEDLLLAVRIPVFTKRAKRKMTTHPKFYYFDCGVYGALRPRGPLDPVDEIEGAAIETLVLQELRATIANEGLDLNISFWRSHKQEEVDFVLYGETGLIAIEVKRSGRFRENELHALNEFLKDYPMAKTYFLYGGANRYKIGGIQVLPLGYALKNLKSLLN